MSIAMAQIAGIVPGFSVTFEMQVIIERTIPPQL
jgi:hypothetical protein